MPVGRAAERRRIDRVLTAARAGRSRALVIRGEAGIGKTALLRYARQRAEGVTVLSARGVEAESEIPFAALSELLRPTLDGLDQIPAPQASALAGALAIGPPAPGDRLAVAAGTLSLLAAAAEERPVLALVDDAHWLDTASAEALLFAARRLGVEGIALLLALRDGESTAVVPGGLDELRLEGLDPRSCERLLAARGLREVAPRIRDRLVEATGGNPLALIEAASFLRPAQLTGREPLDEPLPIGPGIERAYLRRVETLPVATRCALLVAAAAGLPDLGRLPLAALGLEPRVFEPAEAAGLVAIEDGRLDWGHPLVRSAVYHAASPGERREAHRAIAGALTDDSLGDRRAWHLAAATVGTDEDVARALEETAGVARARRGCAAAGAALERAARASPLEDDRARRLLGAARDLDLAGQPGRALILLDQSLESVGDPLVRADIQLLRSWIGIWTGAPLVSGRLLVAETAAIEEADPARAARMLAVATRAFAMAAEVGEGLETARRAFALAGHAAPEEQAVAGVALGYVLALNGESGEGRVLLRRSLALVDERDQLRLHLVQPLVWLEEHETARLVADAAVEGAREAGTLSVLPFALASRSELCFRTGRFAAAHADASESVRLAETVGQTGEASFSLVCLARVEAAQGREAYARAHAARAIELAGARGIESVPVYALAAVGLLELGLGRPMAALPWLEEATRLLERYGIGEPGVIQVAPDLVEALFLSGRETEARRALERFEDEAGRCPSGWSLATAARCRGLLAAGDAFEDELAEALRRHERTPSPFERARTELRLGERLRRARRLIEAREVLGRALETFDRLGAAPWSAQARAELAASGGRPSRRRARGFESLSPQELQIALRVAEGATNREVAAALFLSPKTVEFHLGKAFRKLGLRSRTELARLVADQGTGAWTGAHAGTADEPDRDPRADRVPSGRQETQQARGIHEAAGQGFEP